MSGPNLVETVHKPGQCELQTRTMRTMFLHFCAGERQAAPKQSSAAGSSAPGRSSDTGTIFYKKSSSKGRAQPKPSTSSANRDDDRDDDQDNQGTTARQAQPEGDFGELFALYAESHELSLWSTSSKEQMNRVHYVFVNRDDDRDDNWDD